MPSGTIPHGHERPDANKRHADHATNLRNDEADETYERIIARLASAPTINIPARAHLDPHMTPALMRVFTSMCWHMNGDWECWPGQDLLAAELNITRQAVSKSIQQLVTLGYVEIVRRGYRGSGQTNVYRVIVQRNAGNSAENARENTRKSKNTERAYAPPERHTQPEVDYDHTQPDVASIRNLTLRHTQPDVAQKYTSKDTKSLRTLRDLDDGDGDTREDARTALAEKIVNAGDLPRQTNRAALAQLIANHPQISAGEWEFQAAAAAEWFTDHGRRLTLASLGSWIERYLREQRQLEKQLAEEESTSGRPDEHRSAHGGGRPARQSPSQSGTIPHSPENDVLDYYEGPWESEEEWTRRLLVERAARDRLRAGDAGRN